MIYFFTFFIFLIIFTANSVASMEIVLVPTYVLAMMVGVGFCVPHLHVSKEIIVQEMEHVLSQVIYLLF